MNVREIRCSGFMELGRFSLALPESGLVVVTGPNGAGKSSIVEAVAAALWNKSLRGSEGWRKGEAGDVEVVLDREDLSGGKVAVERKSDKAGRKSLLLHKRGEALKFDNPTKAQEALELEVGSFDQWRRTHVLSSQDAAHFSLATDAERKALLEELLGIGAFDAALDLCRNDLKKVVCEAGEVELEVVKGKERYDATKQAVEAAAFDEPECDPDADAEALRAKVEADSKAYEEARSAYEAAAAEKVSSRSEAAAACAVRAAEVRRLEEAHAKARGKDGVCAECGQRLPAGVAEEIEDKLEEARAEAARAGELARMERAQVEADALVRAERVEELRVALREASEALVASQAADSKAAVERAAVEAWRRRRAAAAGKQAEARSRWAASEEELGRLEDSLASKRGGIAHLRAVSDVLDLRGARVRVLGEALEGVRVVATSWLQKFFGSPVEVRLSATSTLKSGKTVGAISLEVEGVGGQGGYKGLSGGQRRRVDVALLMALAEVAAAAQGRDLGTLFFDEVFDVLDDDGIEAVQRELAELSKRRCVVVISHSKELVDGLPARERVRMG